METSPIIPKVLQLLAARNALGCSLEELTQLIKPSVGSTISFRELTASEKENQASVLETLILLDEQGLIFLNSDTDRSVITIKGLLQIDDKVLCN